MKTLGNVLLSFVMCIMIIAFFGICGEIRKNLNSIKKEQAYQRTHLDKLLEDFYGSCEQCHEVNCGACHEK
jgi:hypothetical protein